MRAAQRAGASLNRNAPRSRAFCATTNDAFRALLTGVPTDAEVDAIRPDVSHLDGAVAGRNDPLTSLFITGERSHLLAMATDTTCSVRARNARPTNKQENDHEDHHVRFARSLGSHERHRFSVRLRREDFLPAAGSGALLTAMARG
jgi:hypothetical protein